MMFASHVGVTVDIDALVDAGWSCWRRCSTKSWARCCRSAGAIWPRWRRPSRRRGWQPSATRSGSVNRTGRLVVRARGREVYSESGVVLQRAWSRDESPAADAARQPRVRAGGVRPAAGRGRSRAARERSPSIPPTIIAAPFIARGERPRIAILREQGVNGQIEMAAAFDRAGFEAVDVHMSDIIAGRASLREFQGFAACGGFSYGDVLGAGEGWAKSILFNPRARDEFEAFFQRGDSFALGVCNGCQMMSNLRDLIPGAEHWPHFVRNRSEQFEARFVMVEVTPSPSLFFAGMAGSRMPIAIAHGEGYAEFGSQAQLEAARAAGRAALRRQPRQAHHDAIRSIRTARRRASPA